MPKNGLRGRCGGESAGVEGGRRRSFPTVFPFRGDIFTFASRIRGGVYPVREGVFRTMPQKCPREPEGMHGISGS